jgi:hypothetical protein
LSFTFRRRGIEAAGVSAEFGTLPPLTVPDALIDENWAFQNPTAHRYNKQKEKLLRAFAPDDGTWRQAVWNEAVRTTRQAIEGLLKAA